MSEDQPHPATAQQLELLRTSSRRRPAVRETKVADRQPVAQVQLDLGLAHLDRVFEYSVPQELSDAAQPGARVKVKFSGQDVAGFVVARTDEADHPGGLRPLRTVVSPEPVLTPTLLALCRRVASRYAGSVSDVVRLAVPPRHARAEAALATDCEPFVPPGAPVDGAWSAYRAGQALLRRITAGESPAASWLAAPCRTGGDDWPAALATVAQASLAGGRGALIVVPDHRDVQRVAIQLEAAIGKSGFVRLTADQGPQARYTAWLKILRGHVRCVVGTRAAAFAPVHDLGLVAWWDDGDPLHSEPRAPYPHVREVMWARHEEEGAALVSGGFTRSVAIEQWLRQDRLREVGGQPAREALPRVTLAGEERESVRHGAAAAARIPPVAWQAAHEALRHGPVLVQVPRRGYVPRLRCAECREPARCERCHGPLEVRAQGAPPTCAWCVTAYELFRCPHCEGTRLTASVIGARRTAEELGRAFPGILVRRSGAGQVLDSVPADPALVISTPGAEPVADDGYAAVLLLDGWALLDREDLQSAEQAVRQWSAAAALARPRATVVLAGADPGVPPVEAMVRWAPGWLAGREYDDRVALDLPPASWAALATGPEQDLVALRQQLPTMFTALGPAPGPQPQTSRLLLRAELADAEAAAHEITVLRAQRGLRRGRERAEWSIRVDPDGAGL